MSNYDLNTSLNYENGNLQEDLIFFKSQNIYLYNKIQDMEDEMRILKEKLVKLTAVEKDYHLNYQPGPDSPDKLLKKSEVIEKNLYFYCIISQSIIFSIDNFLEDLS